MKSLTLLITRDVVTIASLTLEKRRCPDIVVESEFRIDSIQVFLAEPVFRAIYQRAPKKVFFEATKTSIRGAARLKGNYLGLGLIKAIIDFPEICKDCSALPINPKIMRCLGVSHTSRHDGAV